MERLTKSIIPFDKRVERTNLGSIYQKDFEVTKNVYDDTKIVDGHKKMSKGTGKKPLIDLKK